MLWIIVCFLLLSLLCLLLGWSKSSLRQPHAMLQHCFACGWTPEQVQACHLEHKSELVVVPLCFECTIEREAIPVRASSTFACRATSCSPYCNRCA